MGVPEPVRRSRGHGRRMNFGRAPDKRCRECPVVGYRSQERLSASARRLSPCGAVCSEGVRKAGVGGRRRRVRVALRSPVGARGDHAPRLGYAGLRAAEGASAAPGGRGRDGRLPAGAGAACVPAGLRRLTGPLLRVRGGSPRRCGRRGGRVGCGALGAGAEGACRPGPFGPDRDGPGGRGREPGACGRTGGGREEQARHGPGAPAHAALGGAGPRRGACAGALRNGRNSTFRVAGRAGAAARCEGTAGGGPGEHGGPCPAPAPGPPGRARIVCVIAHPAQPFHARPDGNPRIRRPGAWN